MLEPGRRQISPWRALLEFWLQPGPVFAGLRERMTVWPPYLAQMAIMLPAGLLAMSVQARLAATVAAGQALPPGYEQTMQWIYLGGAIMAGLIMPWLAGLLVAAVALFFGQFQGGGVSYRTYLGMVGYARLPIALAALLQSLVLQSAGTLQESMLKSISLAVFLPAGANLYLRGALTAFNPFGIWYYLCLTIGFAALHKTKPSKAWVPATALFAINLLWATANGGASELALRQLNMGR